MRARSFFVLIAVGTFVCSLADVALAGGMGHAEGRAEKQPAEERTAVDVPILAPNDYAEWLEINEGLETGSLTAPGVEPTVIQGPSEPVEVPEGR